MPTQIATYNGAASGTPIAQTTATYDQTSPSPVSVISNTHDETNYSSASNARGNATTVVKSLIGAPTSPTKTYTYDETGQVTTMTDPCGNGSCSTDMPSGASFKTTYSYTDSGTNSQGNSNAYLTNITYPTPPDGTSLQENFTYNYATGELTSAEDENQKFTYYYYNDPFLRPTEVNYPDSGETTYSYNDAAPNPSVTTCNLINGAASAACSPTNPSAGWKTSVSTMDGMGHVIQTSLVSDPDGADNVKIAYDGEGNVYTKTNPFRGSSPPANTTTTFYYDALRRPIKTQEQDGSLLQWCYDGVPSVPSVYCNSTHLGSAIGTWVDSTDENGNHWQRTSDSFGRLLDVLEPNGASQSPTMETDYAYDVLNNLKSVTQLGTGSGSVNRSFSYDSLSRLLSAANPETGTVSYTYDLNSNVATKTDARGVTVNYAYDNLNRLYQKRYSTSAGNTNDPTVCMQYDVPGSAANSSPNPLGRLTMEWTQTAGSACPGLNSPQQTPPSGSISSQVILGYDAMGRLTGDQQCPLGGNCSTPYPFNYTYDLAGDEASATNGIPSSGSPYLSWASYADGAQRLDHIAVTSQPSAWSTSTYLSLPALLQATPSTGYDPFGNLISADLGISASQGTYAGDSSGAVTIARNFDNRDRILSETDKGAISTSGGSAYDSHNTITVGGTESGPLTSTAASGSAVLSVTGSDGTYQYCYYYLGVYYTCITLPDTGDLYVTIDNFTAYAAYGSGYTDASIAAALASSFNASGSPVRASYTSGSTSLTVTAIATGAATNYPITITDGGGYYVTDPYNTLTGGTNAGTNLYDAGTATVTITNNSVSPHISYTASANWGQGSTASSLASSLTSAINSSDGALVRASASGGTITLSSTEPGSNTDYSVSVSQTDSMTANYSTTFPSPSLTVNAVNMTGGTSNTTNYATVYTYAVPTGGYAANSNLLAFSDSVTGNWGSTSNPIQLRHAEPVACRSQHRHHDNILAVGELHRLLRLRPVWQPYALRLSGGCQLQRRDHGHGELQYQQPGELCEPARTLSSQRAQRLRLRRGGQRDLRRRQFLCLRRRRADLRGL